MRNQYKILHINAENSWGGGEVQTLSLCQGLTAKGYHSILACPKESILSKRALALGVDTELFEMNGLFGLSPLFKLMQIIQRRKIDIVHMHTQGAHYLGALAAVIAGVKKRVVTRRMDYLPPNNIKTKLAYGPGVKGIIAISGAVKDVLISFGVSEKKIRIIYSSIDLKDFNRELNSSPRINGKNIGVVANLYERKGIKYLIEAAANILSKHPETVFHIAGDGPLKSSLIEYARSCGVAKSFIFHGHLDNIAHFLKEIDIFIHPALKEGLGVAILEAMAMGKVIVASSTGGIREAVSDGVSGILVPPADPLSLAQSITYLMDHPEDAFRMGNSGRKIVEEKFSAERMVSEYEKVYESLNA